MVIQLSYVIHPISRGWKNKQIPILTSPNLGVENFKKKSPPRPRHVKRVDLWPTFRWTWKKLPWYGGFKLDKNPVKTHQQNYFGGKSGGKNAKRCEYLFVNKRNMDRMCTWTLNGWAIQLFCAQISFFWSAEAPIAQLCKRKDHLVPKCQSQNSNVQAQPDATVWQTKHLFVSKWFHFTLGHIVDFSKGESFRNCFNQELWFRNIFEHQIADSKTCNSQEFPNTSVWRWTLRCSPVSWALETSTDSLEHVLAEKQKRQVAPKLRISIQSCRRNTNNQIYTSIKQWQVFWSKRNPRNWCFVWLSIEQLHAVASVACQEKIHRHCGLETLVATNSIAEATCDPSGIWRYFFCKSQKKSKGHNIFKVLFWWWMFFFASRDPERNWVYCLGQYLVSVEPTLDFYVF